MYLKTKAFCFPIESFNDFFLIIASDNCNLSTSLYMQAFFRLKVSRIFAPSTLIE